MLLILVILTLGIYALQVLFFIYGWSKNFSFEPKGIEKVTLPISIIIPCRNEEKNIRQLISVIAQQSYQNFELILVDDHSTDYTKKFIAESISDFSNMKLLSATGFGKKNAIAEGIHLSTNGLIVTLDADCIPKFHWLESIVCFQSKFQCDLIICPITFPEKSGLFHNLQSFEFISLVAVGASAAGAGKPVLCNGANLAFTRSAWEMAKNDLHKDELSGDDIFLLQSLKAKGRRIMFLKSEAAYVKTAAADSLKAFISQRRRWAAKSPSYTDWHLIAIALIVFFTSTVELFLIGMSVFDFKYLDLLILFFTLKLILDYSFLSKVSKFFHLENVFYYSLLLSIIYPFYIVIVGASALVFKPKKW